MELNQKQERAIKQLERAFKKCSLVKLCFFGMDDNLLAYDYNNFILNAKDNSYYDAQIKSGNGDRVETSNTYLDSSGW